LWCPPLAFLSYQLNLSLTNASATLFWALSFLFYF
jgi:hypothetical protein